jgi:hypothetical protein
VIRSIPACYGSRYGTAPIFGHVPEFAKIALLPGLAGVAQAGLLLALLAIFVLHQALDLRNAWVTRPRAKPPLRPHPDPTDPAETPAIGAETDHSGSERGNVVR